MKNSLWNSDLWQKKRNQLKVDADPDADWKAMRSALDEHMPVVTKPGAGVPSRAVKLAAFVGAGVVAIVAVYMLAHSFITKPDKKDKLTKHTKANQTAVSTDKPDDQITKLKASPAYVSETAAYHDSITQLNTLIASASATLVRLMSGKHASASVRDSITIIKIQIAAAKHALAQTNLNHLHKLRNEKKADVPDLVYVTAKDDASAVKRIKNHNGGVSQRQSPHSASQNSDVVPVANISGNSISNNQPGTITDSNHQINNAIYNNTSYLLTAVEGFHPQDRLSQWFTQIVQLPSYNIWQRHHPGSTQDKIKKDKKPKDSTPGKPLPFDYGLLIGVNSGGSFTAKNQNQNIYGSFPVDGFGGLFAQFNLKDKWGMNVQVRGLVPQNLSGGYSHANQSKVDSGKLIQVSDSRKAYFVAVPVQATFQINNNLKVVAGPVVNVLIKQINGVAALSPSTIQKDSAYYKKTVAQLAGTAYNQRINIGLSAGLNYQYQRLNLGVTYMQSATGYKVVSDFGSYKANPATVQITVGFQLNKLKIR